MLLSQAAFDFIENLDAQCDVPSLLQAFDTMVRKFGFIGFFIGDIAQPMKLRDDRVWGATWPEAWVERFKEKEYQKVDPVIGRMFENAQQFHWRDLRVISDPASARIMDEATEFGLRNGFAFPVHGADGSMVGVSLGADYYELDRRDEACLHIASLYFQAKLDTLRRIPAPRTFPSKLTPRERECLSWVASGKTDWEISQILNIAEQTTHEYVQNAMFKLNATTRAQAVAVAILTKQILQ